MTDEHKKKIGLANSLIMKRLWQNSEYRNHMSEAHKGNKGYWTGKNRSQQTIEKIIQSKIKNNSILKGKNHPRYIHGKSHTLTYRTFYKNNRRTRKRNAEGSHTIVEWELLKKQYGYKCPCCDRKEPEIRLTEDHIIPLVKGGSNYIENIQPLCALCNSRKNVKIITFTQIYDD